MIQNLSPAAFSVQPQYEGRYYEDVISSHSITGLSNCHFVYYAPGISENIVVIDRF